MKPINLTIIQHAKNEPAGLFLEYARQEHIPCETLPLHETQELPALSSTHLLFLGGPMSVNDESLFPYLVEEKRLIRAWIARGRPLLGICLGAQMIASACGGEVSPCVQETGWYDVDVSDNKVLPGFSPSFKAFQFHGETFSLPPGAHLVCRGRQVPNQALAFRSALGLQFHLEPTAKMIRTWISDLPVEEQSAIMREAVSQLRVSYRLCMGLCAIFLKAPAHDFSWYPL